MIASVFATVLLLQASDVPASSAGAAPAAAAKPAKAAPDPNEVVCQSRPITGSRLVKEKVCHTRAEWNQANNVVQQQVNNMENAHGFPGAPGH